MNQKIFILLISLPISLSFGKEEKSFEGYSVVRLYPETEYQLRKLHDIQMLTDSDIMYQSKVDFWKEPKSLNSSVDLMIAPEFKQDILDNLSASGIKGRIMITNLQTLLNEEKKNLASSFSGSKLFYGLRDYENFFADYHTLTEVHQYMDWLSSKRDYVNVVSIGKSTEGRDLKVFEIKKRRRGNFNGPKPLIWIDCGIHAREWISPATCLFMSTQLIEKGDGSDETISDILDNFDFTILPSSNPDGYVHTHENDRMWRKTRSRSNTAWDFVCRGTDPNRNWGFHWNEAGSSSNPCSDIYAGPKPFSEPETKSMSNYILREKDRIALFLTIHSYSQLFLTPWGWTEDLPPAYPDLKRAADSAARALKSLYGTEYTVGSSTQVLYAASGGSDDWAHGAANIKYSYTIELRDTGDHGFVLPKEQIIPTGEETMLALVDLCHTIAQEKKLYTGPVVVQQSQRF